MRIATPKYKLLTSVLEVEPNTTKKIERVDKFLTVEEQLISRINFGGVSSFGGTIDRTIFGLYEAFMSDPDRPIGSVEVLVDPIAGSQSPILYVGPYELVAGRDYASGGGVAATATKIAAAISNIPGYDGTPAGAVITVQGPLGQIGLRFDVEYQMSSADFVFTYTGPNPGELGYITSPIFPPNFA